MYLPRRKAMAHTTKFEVEAGLNKYEMAVERLWKSTGSKNGGERMNVALDTYMLNIYKYATNKKRHDEVQ